MTDQAFTNYFTTAVNQSGRLDYGVDLSKPEYKQILDKVYDSYFEIVGRPPEPSGAVGWITEAISKGWSQDEIGVAIAAGAGASGELSTYVQGNYTYSLTPSVIVSDIIMSAPKINVSYDKDVYAGQYSAGDSGGSSRDTQTIDQKAADFITNLYDTFFDRAPDQAGFDGWLAAYAESGYSQDKAAEIVQGFVNSAENAATKGIGL